MTALVVLILHGHNNLAADEYGTAQNEAGTFQGKIVEITQNDLAIEKSDGEVVRVSLPGETAKNPEIFQMEELVEITMTAEGLTTSMIPVPGSVEP